MSVGALLGVLEAAYLIQLASSRPEPAYVFRHILVRDAVYATLVRRERSHVHQTIGEVLESLHPDEARARQLAPLLGAHFAEAGDEARALRYLTLAGDQAARQFANPEAAQYYARALEFARRQPDAPLAHLYGARGRALELCGEYAEALAGYEEMEAQARERGDPALQLEALAAQAHLRNMFTSVGDPARGRAVLERALPLARRLGDGPAEARLLVSAVRSYAWGGDIQEVVVSGEQAVASARQFGSPQLLAEALIQLANWGYLNDLQIRAARRGLDEAEALLKDREPPQLRLDRLSALFEVFVLSGDLGSALALADEIKQLSDVMGYGWALSRYHTFCGGVRLDQGDLGAALPHLEESIRLGNQFSVGASALVICAHLAPAYAAVGESSAGLAEVRRVREAVAEHLAFLLPWPLAAEGLLHLSEGRVADAAGVIDQARQSGGQKNIFSYRMMLRAESELGLAQENYQPVISLTERVIQEMRAEAGRSVMCEALAYQGRALLGAGDLEKARSTLFEARALAEAIGLRPVLWRILAALAALETRQGNQAAAQALRGELRRLLEDLAERTGSSERRARFLAAREVRAALDE